MILLTESFSARPPRRNEYDVCLNENIKNHLLDKIILFVDDPNFTPDEKFINSEKIVIHRVSSRPTYHDFFTYCNQNFPDQICVIANADIIVGQDLSKLEEHSWDKKFYALTRWDLKKKEDGTYQSIFFENDRGIARASQDTWIFKTPIAIENSHFSLGRPGCDNSIAFLAKKSGMVVTNPSLAIKTFHLHESGIRNYSGRDLVPGPWQIVPPTDDVGKLSDVTGDWPF